MTSNEAGHVVHLVREVLGDDVLAACLHGSAVLGGLRPSSDVDVLVTVRRRTTEAERRALVESLLAVSGANGRSCCPRRGPMPRTWWRRSKGHVRP
ncbi:nucleotidyltransferase domain-containing protein [Streptomyces sp. NPDC015661]|uniref:nucleotidyltransferase domain-containing protein n=1 Tax=Streptomyces sp. NPDC015661 TaxID=3364961 RepID=UPI0036F62C13